MTFLFAHWWTLPSLTLTAVLAVKSIAGLAGLKDTATEAGGDESDRSIDCWRQPTPGRGTTHKSDCMLFLPSGTCTCGAYGKAGAFFDGDAAA